MLAALLIALGFAVSMLLLVIQQQMEPSHSAGFVHPGDLYT